MQGKARHGMAGERALGAFLPSPPMRRPLDQPLWPRPNSRVTSRHFGELPRWAAFGEAKTPLRAGTFDISPSRSGANLEGIPRNPVRDATRPARAPAFLDPFV